METKRLLTTTLLSASLCTTREEARECILRADSASMKLSGTPYGFPMNVLTQNDSDIVTHP